MIIARRVSVLLIAAAILLMNFGTVTAWTAQEHEIFRVQHELEASEGIGTDFYSLLNLARSASGDEISRAYRRKSLEMHPDKSSRRRGTSDSSDKNDNNSVKVISKREQKLLDERFARLGVITSILRDPERRKRYDHFLRNGFPVWRKQGYMYSRWRPTFAIAFLGIYLFICFLALGLSRLNINRRRQSIREMITEAHTAAGPWLTRAQSKQKGQQNPQRKRFWVSDAEKMYSVSTDRSVFVVAPDGSELLVDECEAGSPLKASQIILWLPLLIIKISLLPIKLIALLFNKDSKQQKSE